jgi:2-methylcitrate dehydratase PrpD
MPGDATGELAGFISSTTFDRLDRTVVEYVKRLILDGVANAIAGSRTAPARAQRDVVDDLGSGQGARVLGTGERMSVPAATYVNASCSNMLDFDDTYKTFLHPGATAIAPGFAVAERHGFGGRAVIAAVAVGYEVQIRVAEAAFPSRERRRQVWGFAPWQTLGAAAVAANLLSLDAETTRHALGAAAFNAPVPSIRKLGLEPEDRPFSWVKNNYGWAAMGGLLGTLLARNGFRGTRSVLDGDRGFWAMAGSDRCDFAAMTADLGQDFRLLETSLKPYAACRWTHSALDCVRALGCAGEVDRVEVHTFQELSANFTNPHPDDVIDAQFSLPHLIALELVGRSAAGGLHEADLTDEPVNRLAERVSVHHDPAADEDFHAGRMPSRVVCHLRSGETIERTVTDPLWGSPTHPFTDTHLLAKCQALIKPSWPTTTTDRLVEGILNLDTIADVTTILPS